MTKSILRFSLLGLLTVAVAGVQGRVQAQDTQKPLAEKKETVAKKHSLLPFHGKLKAIDKTAKTISVGESTIQITSETKIFKSGSKPATLEDGVVGEDVSGAYRNAEDGKLNATTVRFGSRESKHEAGKDEKKQAN